MTATLLAEPQWMGAARALVSGCIDLPNADDAVGLMETVCLGLGDQLYPAFLRVLCEVGRHGDHGARAAVAQTLVHALCSGFLPSGRRPAWGSSPHTGSIAGGVVGGRSLGPLEYLCAWAGQGDPSHALPARDFDASAQALMALVSASDGARRLYCDKLMADALEPVEGTLSRAARQAMLAMAQAWGDGATPAEASARFLSALPEPGAGGRAWPTAIATPWPPR
jgi:hypothetical protein